MAGLTPQVVAAWQPSVGDPTLMGWVIAGCYLLAGFGCLRCWHRRNRLVLSVDARRFGHYWVLLGVMMLLMGLNKQLDMQVLLHDLARKVVDQYGFAGSKRQFKNGFIGLLAVLFAVWLGRLVVLMSGLWVRVWLSGVGVFVLLAFVLSRAVSVYIVKLPLGESIIGGVRYNHVFELIGVVAIGLGSMANMKRRKTKSPIVSHAMS